MVSNKNFNSLFILEFKLLLKNNFITNNEQKLQFN